MFSIPPEFCVYAPLILSVPGKSRGLNAPELRTDPAMVPVPPIVPVFVIVPAPPTPIVSVLFASYSASTSRGDGAASPGYADHHRSAEQPERRRLRPVVV